MAKKVPKKEPKGGREKKRDEELAAHLGVVSVVARRGCSFIEGELKRLPLYRPILKNFIRSTRRLLKRYSGDGDEFTNEALALLLLALYWLEEVERSIIFDVIFGNVGPIDRDAEKRRMEQIRDEFKLPATPDFAKTFRIIEQFEKGHAPNCELIRAHLQLRCGMVLTPPRADLLKFLDDSSMTIAEAADFILSSAYKRLLGSKAPSRNAVLEELRRAAKCGKLVRVPTVKPARYFSDSVRKYKLEKIEELAPNDDIAKLPVLSELETSLVLALGKERMVGRQIAERTQYKYDSVTKGALANLVRREILSNYSSGARDQRGYQLRDDYIHLLEELSHD